MLLQRRWSDEGRFAGSRSAPEGCQIFDHLASRGGGVSRSTFLCSNHDRGDDKHCGDDPDRDCDDGIHFNQPLGERPRRPHSQPFKYPTRRGIRPSVRWLHPRNAGGVNHRLVDMTVNATRKATSATEAKTSQRVCRV